MENKNSIKIHFVIKKQCSEVKFDFLYRCGIIKLLQKLKQQIPKRGDMSMDEVVFEIVGNKNTFLSFPAGAIIDSRLKGSDIRVLYLFYMLSDKQKMCVKEFGVRKLSRLCNIAVNTFLSCIENLEENGWLEIIETEKQFESNIYKLKLPEDIPA